MDPPMFRKRTLNYYNITRPFNNFTLSIQATIMRNMETKSSIAVFFQKYITLPLPLYFCEFLQWRILIENLKKLYRFYINAGLNSTPKKEIL